MFVFGRCSFGAVLPRFLLYSAVYSPESCLNFSFCSGFGFWLVFSVLGVVVVVCALPLSLPPRCWGPIWAGGSVGLCFVCLVCFAGQPPRGAAPCSVALALHCAFCVRYFERTQIAILNCSATNLGLGQSIMNVSGHMTTPMFVIQIQIAAIFSSMKHNDNNY